MSSHLQKSHGRLTHSGEVAISSAHPVRTSFGDSYLLFSIVLKDSIKLIASDSLVSDCALILLWDGQQQCFLLRNITM